jgi:hypothetical protein
MTAIRAELAGSDTCTAAGIKAKGKTPVLNLCRLLLAVGRNGTLALKVRSIGEGAALDINSKGTGFVPYGAVRTASPTSQNGERVPRARSSGTPLSEAPPRSLSPWRASPGTFTLCGG